MTFRTEGGDREAAGTELAASLFVYSLPPIDWWYGWTPLAEMVRPIDEWDDGYTARLLVERAVTAATQFSRRTWWEGDGRWYVAPLPVIVDGAQEIEFILACKQSNNGSTFVCSPVPLAHLEEYAEP